MDKRRVVVTGLGIVSPVGNTVQTAWTNILAGQSGVSQITDFDTENFTTKFSASVKDFDVTQYVNKKNARKMSTFVHYGVAAATQAIDDAGFEVTEENAELIGVAIGAGIGGLPQIETQYQAYQSGGSRKISPFFVPSTIINMISGNVSIMYGLKGPNFCITTACTTGTHNISESARVIEYGDADIMIAGGAEMATCPLGLGGFGAAKALSTRNDDPQAASRPFDEGRDGFVLGDGAGVLVLEEYEHAKKRGARIYAELSGGGMSGDAHHITQPAANGDGARRCMLSAMRHAKLNPEDVQYINAHGTSTPAGDVAETQAIRGAMGSFANQLLVSSTKSMTGHLLGAAGAIEAVFSVLSIRDQIAPPTINLFDPDPDCDLDYVAHEARECRIENVLSNSFGFGGTNGTIAFSKI